MSGRPGSADRTRATSGPVAAIAAEAFRNERREGAEDRGMVMSSVRTVGQASRLPFRGRRDACPTGREREMAGGTPAPRRLMPRGRPAEAALHLVVRVGGDR